ncbi:YceI family protein [Abyssalbus ytuae]|uniref:YceI family protein n=1 Tax=Abyssalbus ytuae TaxID=2926907 RepID=A0A9E7CTI0_9FLAO|nr:YceI family protein [Abyssalbus ytuae]UOB18116.1 YceI family protein [Abyssalbus ytuae]
MKSICFLVLSVFLFNLIHAQEKYITRQGHISFFSHSPVEDIEAYNDQVLSIVNANTGEVAVSLLMKSFIFEKSLMQEHFNENYVESDIYPKATFSGTIENFEEAKQTGEALINGNLTLHGATKDIKTKAKITIAGDSILLKGNFMVEVADFDIKIPAIVANNIAKTIKISFELDHQPYN